MSSNSPIRSSFTAQRRSRDSTIGKHNQLSQKAPEIDSPRLNEETDRSLKETFQNNDLKTKLELLLKHNSQLLNENAQLSELVNSLRIELEIKTRKEETDFAKINQEMGNVMV